MPRKVKGDMLVQRRLYADKAVNAPTWKTNLGDFEERDIVFVSGSLYYCIADHTPTSFGADSANWIELGAAVSGQNIMVADITADASHTQSFADFGQTWNNLSNLVVNQEFSGFPGNFGTSTFTTGGFTVTSQNAAGNGGNISTSPLTGFRLNGQVGTDEAYVDFDAATQDLRLRYVDTGGGNSNEIKLDGTSIDLIFGATSPLQLNGQPGNAGQVLTSSGAGEPPYWSTAATDNLYTANGALLSNRDVDMSGSYLSIGDSSTDASNGLILQPGNNQLFVTNVSGNSTQGALFVREQAADLIDASLTTFRTGLGTIGFITQVDKSTEFVKISTPGVAGATVSNGQVLQLTNAADGTVEFADAASKTVVDKKAAGPQDLSLADMNKFIVVSGSGVNDTITLPNVTATEQDCAIEIYNNGLEDVVLAVSGNDTLIGSSVLEAGKGALLKVTDTNEIIAVGTGVSIQKYTGFFTQANWSNDGSGVWSLSVPESTHGVGIDYQAQVWSGAGAAPPYSLVTVDGVVVGANGDLTLTTTDVSGFDGKYNLIG